MARRDIAAKSEGRMRESFHMLDRRMSGCHPTVDHGDKSVRMPFGVEGECRVVLYDYL